jgi:hypothetical protein
LIVLYTVLVFAAGVAIQKAGVIRSTLDLFTRQSATELVRRVSGYLTTPDRLTIDIAHRDFMNLAHQRDVALARQVLIVSDEDVVPALVRHNGRAIPVRLRLKGDLTDHLAGDKWSFRIIARNDSTIFGMKQFSLQHPGTRDFVSEKVYHDAMRREGIVALRYQFLDLTVNGKGLGLYALEEAFETRLIEHNERKNGPIVRFNEDVLWGELARQTTVHPRERTAVAGAGTYLSSDVDAFQTATWLATEEGRAQYLTAIQLLDGFRRGKLSVAEAFDMPRLATFFALTDLLRGWHGASNWPNARFYYNPITSRLEPIAFDAYNRSLPASPGLMALQAMNEAREPAARQYASQFFADSTFYRLYLSELERVSAPEYLEALIAEIGPELTRSLRLLRREFPGLEFSWEPLHRAANFIQIALHPPQGIQAYFRSASRGSLELEVANMQALPLRVVGLARDSSVWEAPAVHLPGKTDRDPMRFQLARFAVPPALAWPDTLPSPLRVRYQVVGTARVDEAPALPWPHDGLGEAPLRAAPPRLTPNVESFPFLTVDVELGRIGIRPGTWRVDRNMVLPPGYRIFAGPGTRLDLVKGAAIVTYSPVELRGEADSPVVIESSDSTGQGLSVFQARGQSRLEYVDFNGLTNPKQHGWELTGAVTFYESPVEIQQSRFRNNHSEDALHLMRGDFALVSVSFENTSADALDIDFGKGSIGRTSFTKAGNDGIDASGSFVTLEDITIQGAGDKGVSAGEGTTLEARNLSMREAMIGLASKDRSTVRVTKAEIVGGQIGVTAYLKKTEFGAATIVIRDLELRGQEHPFMVERLSSVTVDGRQIPANREKVADILYGAVYGKASR